MKCSEFSFRLTRIFFYREVFRWLCHCHQSLIVSDLDVICWASSFRLTVFCSLFRIKVILCWLSKIKTAAKSLQRNFHSDGFSVELVRSKAWARSRPNPNFGLIVRRPAFCPINPWPKYVDLIYWKGSIRLAQAKRFILCSHLWKVEHPFVIPVCGK